MHTGMYLWDHGITPLIPHLSMLAHLISPRDISVWYAMDIELLSRCDALYRMFGNSKGADKEVKYAVKRKIPVYYNINLVVDDMGI